MAHKEREPGELKGIGYEIFIGALSVLSIINLVILLVFAKEQTVQYVINIMDTIFLPIFLGDFFYRLFTAPSKSDYFLRSFGWADLLSSMPFPQAKLLRLFRIWRLIRLSRQFGARNLVREFIQHRADNALLTVVFLVLCVLEFGAMAIVYVEAFAPGANITTASDALWWTYVTITTVGYGDTYPVTNTGRMIGLLVMTAGVGLFGTLSGFLANKLLTQPPPKEEAETGLDSDDPRARIQEIREMLAAHEQVVTELKTKLDGLDQLLSSEA